VLLAPTANRTLSKLIVIAIFADCRLVFLLDTFIKPAEGFQELALSFQSLALCETGVVVCHEEEKLSSVVTLDRVGAPNINMNELTEFVRLTLR
jgi:hypothetical protein